jgi:hypothetical protein
VARTRKVIDLPPPAPVEVLEHQVIERSCPHCATWKTPTLDLTGQVLGQGRIGVRVAALVAYLRTVLRLPIRRIQDSAVLHADETGWREDGQNGYIWAFSTPGSGVSEPLWDVAGAGAESLS